MPPLHHLAKEPKHDPIFHSGKAGDNANQDSVIWVSRE
jgi:hypothetical protein